MFRIKKIFPSALIVILSVSFIEAQLTVRNGAFIYADDTVIYVDDNVNLTEADTRIFLRNEAQLIQGEPAVYSGNSGLGKLSVYQAGTVSEFNYNYWCSPVGNRNANDNANRDFILQNHVYYETAADTTSSAATYTNNYDGTSPPLVISRTWLFTYDPGLTYNDWDYVGETGAIPAGRGFTMKGTTSGPGQVYDFRGKPNNHDINVPIGTTLENTLTGNPYSSALDAYDLIHNANNAALIDGVLLYWEQNSSSHILTSYIGGYGAYTIDVAFVESWTRATFTTFDSNGNQLTGAGFGTDGTPGTNVPGRYIPIGQGFMVTSDNAVGGDLHIRNSMRNYEVESTGNSHFFGIEDNSMSLNATPNFADDTNNVIEPHGVPEGYLRFRLIVDLEANNEFFSRELLMNLADYATDDYDYGMEARIFKPYDSDASWVQGDDNLVIQARTFDQELRLPLRITLTEQANVGFRIYDIQNFPDSQSIYLHDLENQVYHDLRQSDWSVPLEEGEYADRFEITFINQETLDDSEFTIDDFEVYQDNNAARLVINNPNMLTLKDVQLNDVSGKRVFDSGDLETLDNYSFPTNTLSDGVYIATLNIEGQKPLFKKVLVHNK